MTAILGKPGIDFLTLLPDFKVQKILSVDTEGWLLVSSVSSLTISLEPTTT